MNNTRVGDYDAIANRDIEVDYDFNPTQLYLCISDSNWYETLRSLKENAIQGRIWVVKTENRYERDESTCRFLPIHSACAREPPLSVVAALLEAYPEGARRQDDNGMYPLHYACANHASAEVIQLLLNCYPDARYQRIEASGALPIHLAAQWGVSSIMVMKHLLMDNNSLASARDSEGLSPLEIAIDADYREGKVEMINILRDSVLQDTIEYSSTISSRGGSTDDNDDDDTGTDIDTDFDGVSDLENETSTQSNGEDYTQTVEQLKEEVLNLQNKKAYIKSSVDDQLKLEWKAVKTALGEMEEKIGKLEHKSGSETSGTTALSEGSSDESRQDTSSSLETIKAENIRMEDELEVLDDIYDAHCVKVEAVEQIIKELADTITKIATGHNSTIARLKKKEKELIRMSQQRAAKLKELSNEVDSMAQRLTSFGLEKEEKKAFDVLKKEQEILVTMGNIVRVLKS